MPETKSPRRFVDGYLLYLLAHASFLLSSQFHAQVKQAGLAIPEWRVLATLSDGDGLSIGALARISLHKQPTLTKIINRMERDGLVERRSEDADRRVVQVFITAKGRARVAKLLTAAQRHEALATAGLSPEELRTVKSALGILIARLEEDEAGPAQLSA